MSSFARGALDKGRAALGILPALLVVSPHYAFADAQTWTGNNDTSADWSVNANWSNNAAPTSTTDVTIDNGALAKQPALSVNSNAGSVTMSAGSLNLGNTTSLTVAGAFTMTGGTLLGNTTLSAGTIDISGGNLAASNSYHLSATGAFNLSNVTLAGFIVGATHVTIAGGTVSFPEFEVWTGGVTINTGATLTAVSNGLGSGTVTMQDGSTFGTLSSSNTSNAFSLTGSATINTPTNPTLSGVISGTGTLVKTGVGTLTLSGTNTYVGGTTVTGGLIKFAAANNFGTGSITLNGGGLQWATGNTVDISSRLAALGASGGTLDTNGNNVTLASAISGTGGLTKIGGGILTLTGTNSYTGATTINAGTLEIGAIGTQGAIVGAVTNSASFNLVNADMSGVTSIANTGGSTHFRNATAAGALTITNSGGGTTHFDNTSTANTATINNNGTSDLHFNDSATAASAAITNTGALSVTHFNQTSTAGSATITNVAGSMVFNDSSTGGTATINTNGGSTTFRNTSTAGTATVTTTSGGTTTFQDTASGGSASFVTNGTGRVDFSALSAAATAGSIAGSGTYVLGANQLTVGSNDSSTTMSGVISGSGGSLVKTGSGVLMLSGSNTYTGGTTVSAGTLRLGANNALPTAGALTVASGATFDLANASQAIGSLSGAGAVTLGGALLAVGDGTSTSFSGVISGGGGALTKTGAGMLTLSGANTYTGATTVNAGILAVNGSITSNTTVNTGGTLQGTGTITGNVTVAGTIAPGNSIGTINVIGNYIQNGGSTYTVEVNAAGQSDKINITGTATLNGGTVSVQAAGGTYARNTTYTILSATGGVSGTYAGVTSNFAFLRPSLSYGINDVLLALLSTGTSFRDGAQTPNQVAVGAALDQAAPTATGDFNTVLNALYGLSTSQGPQVLNMLGGQGYSGFGSLMMQSSLLFMTSFQIQAGSGSTGSGAGLPGGSTYQALKTDSADSCNTACDVEPLWGVWGGGVGAFGTVAGNANAAGTTYNLGGFMAGLDRKLGSGFKAGVAAGFNAASLYTNGIPGTGTSNTVQFAVYGEYQQDAFYLDALAGYAHSDNRMTRPLVIPGLPYRAAQGYATANTFFGQLEAGYKVMVAPSFGGFVTPFARLQGVTSTQNGFSETGADSLNLTVATQTTNSLRTVVGAQLGAGIDAPWREKLNMVFRLGWSHEFADTARPVNAAFAGAPAIGFTTFGAQAPRDGVVLGLGANTLVAERTSVYLRYDGDLAGGNTNHTLSAGVRYVW